MIEVAYHSKDPLLMASFTELINIRRLYCVNDPALKEA